MASTPDSKDWHVPLVSHTTARPRQADTSFDSQTSAGTSRATLPEPHDATRTLATPTTTQSGTSASRECPRAHDPVEGSSVGRYCAGLPPHFASAGRPRPPRDRERGGRRVRHVEDASVSPRQQPEAVDEEDRGVARGVSRLDLPVLPLGNRRNPELPFGRVKAPRHVTAPFIVPPSHGSPGIAGAVPTGDRRRYRRPAWRATRQRPVANTEECVVDDLSRYG